MLIRYPAMTRRSDDWWKRHPNLQFALQFAFLLLWSAFAFTWGVGVLRQGSFRWGKGSGGPIITPASDPILFWTWVCGAFVAGVTALVINLRGFIRYWRGRAG